MTGNELLYVKTVAEEMSISKAAKKLFISQPSLSNAIMKIENSLGVKLFTRTNRGLKLTYAGERYCQVASDILRSYNDFEIEVSDINNFKKGRLNIGITTYIASYLLPKILPEFKKLAPNIEFNFTEKNSTDLEEEIKKGSVDFAVMHKSANDEPDIKGNLQYTKIAKNRFLLVTRHDHEIKDKAILINENDLPYVDIRDLEYETFILGNKGQRSRQIVDSIFQNAKISPSNTMITRSFTTAKELAAQRIGVTILPEFYLDLIEGTKEVDCYNINVEYCPFWHICVTTNINGYLSKASELFISLIGKDFEREDLLDKVKLTI
jgi:DNA-binding transcriptional LysR family regulator